jgi:peroxiredoxin Q/BCP
VTLFAASCDDEETNTKFAKKLEVSYTILADPKKEAATAMGVMSLLGYPKRWTFYVGKDGKLLAIAKKVNVKAHGEEIAEKLRELGIEKKKAGDGEETSKEPASSPGSGG